MWHLCGVHPPWRLWHFDGNSKSTPDVLSQCTYTAMQCLDKQLWQSRISMKLTLCNTCILPIFLCDSECLAVTKGIHAGSVLFTNDDAFLCSLELNGTTLSPVMKYNAEPINLYSLKSFRHDGSGSCWRLVVLHYTFIIRCMLKKKMMME